MTRHGPAVKPGRAMQAMTTLHDADDAEWYYDSQEAAEARRGPWWADLPADGQLPPSPPPLCKTINNTPAFQAGITNVFAPGGRGKSFIALAAAEHVYAAGGRVIWLTEMSLHLSMLRIQQLDLLIEFADPDRFRLVTDRPLRTTEMVKWLTEPAETGLLIVDSLRHWGGEHNHADKFTEWADEHIEPYRGLANVLILSHTPISHREDEKFRTGRGSGALRDLVDNQYEIIGAPWARNRAGTLKVKATKDRSGTVAEDQTAFKVKGSPDSETGTVAIRFEAPGEEDDPAMAPLEKQDPLHDVAAMIRSKPGISGYGLEQAFKGQHGKDVIRHSLNQLVEAGQIRYEKGPRNSHRWHWGEDNAF